MYAVHYQKNDLSQTHSEPGGRKKAAFRVFVIAARNFEAARK